jgi:hypothetical protein
MGIQIPVIKTGRALLGSAVLLLLLIPARSAFSQETTQDDPPLATIEEESTDVLDVEDDATIEREDAFHIQVLRNPYDLARFYRVNGHHPAFNAFEPACGAESVLSNPYLISSFYRNDGANRHAPLLMAPCFGRRLNGREPEQDAEFLMIPPQRRMR